MRKLFIAASLVLLALATASVVQAKGKPVPATPVPTSISIDGAVYTTVDLNDPNYSNECKNGNPAVNCNQYAAKQFVFLNGGPTHNHLTPDGVYFFSVLNPSGQSNPADGTPDNLSDDYDCYKNREVIIKNGEVSGVLTSTDTNCFHNTAVLPVGTGHKLSGPQGPFVQLWPYIDTPNPGGVYIMAVCWVASPSVTPTAPVALANETTVDPSKCKYDAFKVLEDHTPPVCKLYSTNNATSTSHKSITVLVQDAGAGLESIVYSGFNFINPPTFPTPLVPGTGAPFYIIATKDDPSQGSTFALTITDVAGNTTTCDPAFGMPFRPRSVSLQAGHRLMLKDVSSDHVRLWLRTGSPNLRKAIVVVNGHRFAVVSLSSRHALRLNLAGALSRHKNTITVVAGGTSGELHVRVTN
jgi:hypothetical protein